MSTIIMTDNYYSDAFLSRICNLFEHPPDSPSDTTTAPSEDDFTIPQFGDLIDPSILDRHFDPDLLATIDRMTPFSQSDVATFAVLPNESDLPPPSSFTIGSEEFNPSPAQSPSTTVVSPNFAIQQSLPSPEATFSPLISALAVKRQLEEDFVLQETQAMPGKRRRRSKLEIATEHHGGGILDFGNSSSPASSQVDERDGTSDLSLNQIRERCQCPNGPPKTKLRRHWDEACESNPNKKKDFVCEHPGCGNRFGRLEYFKRHQKKSGHQNAASL